MESPIPLNNILLSLPLNSHCYGSGSTVNTKFLRNKIVNIDKLIVPESQDNLQSKMFTFINNKNGDLFLCISIST